MQRPERRDDGGGEFGIVDVALDPDQLPVAVWRTVRSSAREQRGVGLRVAERLARRIERGDAELGQEEAHRPVHAVEPLADPAADALVLVRGGAHQRDLRIVGVQLRPR